MSPHVQINAVLASLALVHVFLGPWTTASIAPRRAIRGFGRGGRIRTFDLLVPNQALYQAEPRPELSSLVCCTPRTQARTIENVSDTQKLRELPAVHEVLEQLSASLARFPRALVVSESCSSTSWTAGSARHAFAAPRGLSRGPRAPERPAAPARGGEPGFWRETPGARPSRRGSRRRSRCWSGP